MDYSNYEIVCVDDDLEVLETTMALVEHVGVPSVGISNARKAAEYISKNKDKILMVLSDLRMDDVNGFEFKKMIQPFASDIPFGIITGYWTKEISSEAMGLGIEAFIEKPATLELIKQFIDKFGNERAVVLTEEKEMVVEFIEESYPMLEEIESLILELEEDPKNEQVLSTYFRLLHTIKGTASCVGLISLGHYTHEYEDFIGELRNHIIPVNTLSTNVLLLGLDDLKGYFQQVKSNGKDIIIDLKLVKEKFNIAQVTKKATEEEAEAIEEGQIEKKVGGVKEGDKVNISVSLLNDFMEDSGELTVIRNSIMKTVNHIEQKFRGDADIELLNELLGGMHTITSSIQNKITEMRKVSLKNTFRPFKRLVRDLSKKLDKNVNFEIFGDELLVDSSVSKLFSTTMIHIVRNSLDHGLETTSERQASGKSTTGILKITIKEIGEDVVLEVIDDGKGINPSIIKKIAIEKGLYTRDAINLMSDLEIINIIFKSGFSTAEVVTDLSGRGVGMDMVRSSFEEMGGSIYVQSVVGKGSTFRLTVPAPKSVLIINTLIVRCIDQHYIFHMEEVAEVIRFEKESINTKMYRIESNRVLNHNGKMIELIDLAEYLNLPQENRFDLDQRESYNIVILKVGSSLVGVFVDEIYEFEEVVSRKIPMGVDTQDIYLGASLLGSGEVAMIISAQGLAKLAGVKIESSMGKELLREDTQIADESSFEYMVFKYNPSDYLAIKLDAVYRLETINATQFCRTGNLLFIRYGNEALPLVEPGYLLGLNNTSRFEELRESASDIDLEIIVVNSKNKQFGIVVYELDDIQCCNDALDDATIDLQGLIGSLYLKEQTISVADVEFFAECLGRKIILSDRQSDIYGTEDRDSEDDLGVVA